ncbi:MAG TPA: ABC transporter ATP-binding protein [Devosiaceae bacterium]
MPSPAAPSLDVRDLSVVFDISRGRIEAVRNINLSVAPGEVVGLVGESGSGKSVTGFALMGLIDPPGRIASGTIELAGHGDLLQKSPGELQSLRGREIAMVFQDPMTTLNPVLTIGTQVTEAIHAHERVGRRAAFDRGVAALRAVGIADPGERMHAYPHHMSGGMRQRIAIAIAMLHRPKVLIADEPTTALDVTIQGQILAQTQELCHEYGTAAIWITHDLAVVAGLADRVMVMYAGSIVEAGQVSDVIDRPLHHYTGGLIASVPGGPLVGGRLAQIPGMAPDLLHRPAGCTFAPRCPRADTACRQDLAWVESQPGHRALCVHPLAADRGFPTSQMVTS